MEKNMVSIDELVERFVAEAERSIAARDWETYGSFFAEDLLMVTPALPGPTTGRDARLKFVQGIMDSFPDGLVEVQREMDARADRRPDLRNGRPGQLPTIDQGPADLPAPCELQKLMDDPESQKRILAEQARARGPDDQIRQRQVHGDPFKRDRRSVELAREFGVTTRTIRCSPWNKRPR